VSAATALLASAAGFLAAADPDFDWPVGPTATAAALTLFAAVRAWTRIADRSRRSYPGTPIP